MPPQVLMVCEFVEYWETRGVFRLSNEGYEITQEIVK
jgi:hypothetical protein